jgi:hypothetical protein
LASTYARLLQQYAPSDAGVHDVAHLANGAGAQVARGVRHFVVIVVVAVYVIRNCANVFVRTFAADGDGTWAFGAWRGLTRYGFGIIITQWISCFGRDESGLNVKIRLHARGPRELTFVGSAEAVFQV